MDAGLFFSGILSSAGIFSLLQFLISRHDKKKDELVSIKRELGIVKHTLDETILRVTRAELKDLIFSDPENIDGILQVAEYYFIELDGNAYAHAMFMKWAKEHGVETGWLPKITKGVNNGKKAKH